MKEIIRLMKEVEYISSCQRIQDDDIRRCLFALSTSVKMLASYIADGEGDHQ
jgi:hypothetical protein